MDADRPAPFRTSAPSSSTPSSEHSIPHTLTYSYDSTNPQSPHSATLGPSTHDDDDDDYDGDHGTKTGTRTTNTAASADDVSNIANTNSNNNNNNKNKNKNKNGAHTGNGNISNDPFLDLKRPRACEACRQLKVRCDPHTEDPDGPCKRCARANRRCVVTVRTRKRRKKADGRVAELERKIDALTASLQASKTRNDGDIRGVVGGGLESPQVTGAEELTTSCWLALRPDSEGRRRTVGGELGHTSGLAGNKRYSSGNFKPTQETSAILAPLAARSHSPMTEGLSTLHDGTATVPSDHGDGNAPDPWPPLLPLIDRAPKVRYDHEYTDVIDRGIVDQACALKSFNRYVNDIAPLFPCVVFPPETTMAEVRRTKPVVFLAILSISIGVFRPEVQVPLLNEVYRVYADQVVVKGSKSLELVQALVISAIWYVPPDHYEEMKFFQLIHIAVAMGMDLGMNRRTKSKSKSKSMGMWRDIVGKKAVMLDPDAPETRRAWLGCYFMSVNVSMSLRRPLLTRWHPYMDECLEILGTSPDAFPSDKALIHWAKLAHIGEEILFQFSMDDPVTNVDITDPKIQYALKGFERRLEKWRKGVPSECYSPVLHHYELIINLYMHEIGMHADHNIDDFKPPFANSLDSETSVDLGTPAHVAALTVCLTSIHEAFETFFSIDNPMLQCLPTIHFVRTAYASVALIKLYTAASHPSTRLGQVFNPTHFRIEHLLDKLIQHLIGSGDHERGRVPARFSIMLGMLKAWFVKRGEGKQMTIGGGHCFFQPRDLRAYTAPDRGSSEPESGYRKKPSHSAESTHLYLLSQAAVGRPEIKTRSENNPNPDQNVHSPQESRLSPLTQPSLSPQSAHVDTPDARSLPIHPTTAATVSTTPNTVPNQPWPTYGLSGGMGAFPSGSNPPLTPQYLPQIQNQNHGFNPLDSGGPSGLQQAFLLYQDQQMVFQPDEFAVLGAMWDDIFFGFPLDETAAPL
ncbi:uncharacterized protein PADG_04363 [Paracoccidioides brasiliensis Pb18]|uniref:Zn(2)-C6 fungal-type domain-containing protein n=1 Tax=Paracoccidioides brasiliensis (strain Pb18) TaxID=502780 RepID=C1GAS7_PARBD|nr:uncharacterized protein PADG_04363 [Paracoccidioides brasiliensis Pb18]EEH48279.2 hypothetical protein PADG_04363 [Paracoccidioides brasiliensis Pb18]